LPGDPHRPAFSAFSKFKVDAAVSRGAAGVLGILTPEDISSARGTSCNFPVHDLTG
jgi:hypothetical protein